MAFWLNFILTRSTSKATGQSSQDEKDSFSATDGRYDVTYFWLFSLFVEPRHWVCKPAYLVPALSQDKLGALRQEGHPAQKWGMMEVGR